MSVRVRFAPSPTGYLRVVGARTALYNYLFAKHRAGDFILRIEDTDRERSTKESVDAILNGLKWLGLNWDEGPECGGDCGPYFQSERTDIYEPYINKLLETGNAYKCFCTKEELDEIKQQMREAKKNKSYDGRCRNLTPEQVKEKEAAGMPYVIRIKAPDKGVEFNDLIRGSVNFSADQLDDFIIQRSEGTPVYNFVVTIDDLTMKITHVIRGEDHISNTPKQIIIYSLLGEKIPEFAHIPLILGSDKKRLSKRHGATSTDEYRKKGYPVEAFVNYLALLGWSYDDKTTLFSRQDLIEKFSLDKVSKSGAVFDEEKLNWLSGVYIREMNDEELFEKAKPFLEESNISVEGNEEKIKALLGLVKERITVLSHAPGQISYFFQQGEYDKKARKSLKKADTSFIEKYLSLIENHGFENAEKLETDTKAFLEKEGAAFKDLMPFLRASLVYTMSGPHLFDIMYYLGKKETVNRVKNGIEYVNAQV